MGMLYKKGVYQMEQNIKWKDVTKTFEEERRYYRNTYLEKCEILSDDIEVSKFIALSDNEKDEIYVNFDILNGVTYVRKNETDTRYRQIKREIKAEYLKNKKPSEDFVNSFAKKYDLDIFNNVFNCDDMFKAMLNCFDGFDSREL